MKGQLKKLGGQSATVDENGNVVITSTGLENDTPGGNTPVIYTLSYNANEGTGATKGLNPDRNQKLNIYDLAGNISKWTLEYTSSSSSPCASRGGYYSIGSSNRSANSHAVISTSGSFDRSRIPHLTLLVALKPDGDALVV